MSNEFYFQWHITNKCGNRCSHCYQDSYFGKDISLELVDSLLKDIQVFCKEIDCYPKIAFVGGDPFQHKDFIEIINKTKKITDNINILGNPEIITKDDGRLIKYLKDLKLGTYQLSIDGLENTHDSIRYKGSFNKTLRAINILSENQINVTVLSTVSKTNYKEMLEVMDIAYANGAYGWDFSRIVTEDVNLCVNKKEYKIFVEQIIQKHEKYVKVGKPFLTKDPLLSIVYKNREDDLRLNEVGRCGIGGPIFTIMPSGEIMACRRHPGSSLGVWSKDNNFVDIFLYNEKLNQMRELHKIDNCGSCKLIDSCCGCRAIAYLQVRNNIFAQDPQCFLNS